MAGTDRLLAGPVDVYVAPEGTAHQTSLITARPRSPWRQLAGGWHNDDGVQVQRTKDMRFQEVQNELEPVDAFIASQRLIVSFTMMDMQVEAAAYALGMERSDIITVAADPTNIGTRRIDLIDDDHKTHKIALLVRGDTPYANGEKSNFYAPRVVVSSDFDITLMLADPAGVPIEFTSLKHQTLRPFFIAQTAATT